MVGVEQWAEIRRMYFVKRLSIREIVRRTGPGQPPQIIRVRLSSLLRDGDISQDVPMRPGDTLIIPQSWF